MPPSDSAYHDSAYQVEANGPLSPELRKRIETTKNRLNLTLAQVGNEFGFSGPFLSTLLRSANPGRVRTKHIGRIISALEKLEARAGTSPDLTQPKFPHEASSDRSLPELIRAAHKLGFSVSFAPLHTNDQNKAFPLKEVEPALMDDLVRTLIKALSGLVPNPASRNAAIPVAETSGLAASIVADGSRPNEVADDESSSYDALRAPAVARRSEISDPNEENFYDALDGPARKFIDSLRAQVGTHFTVYFTAAGGADLRIRCQLPNQRARTLLTMRWRPQRALFWCEVLADVSACLECGFPPEQVALSKDAVMHTRILLDPVGNPNQIKQLICILRDSERKL